MSRTWSWVAATVIKLFFLQSISQTHFTSTSIKTTDITFSVKSANIFSQVAINKYKIYQIKLINTNKITYVQVASGEPIMLASSIRSPAVGTRVPQARTT